MDVLVVDIDRSCNTTSWGNSPLNKSKGYLMYLFSLPAKPGTFAAMNLSSNFGHESKIKECLSFSQKTFSAVHNKYSDEDLQTH